MSHKKIIWIRHAEKLYNNGRPLYGGKAHDSPLRMDSSLYTQVSSKFMELISIYGMPNKIYCSPFLRTRETASIILDLLNTFYLKKFSIENCNEVSEYLGFCKNKNLSLEDETLKLHPNITMNESLEDLEKRVKLHIEKMSCENGVVWVITHGLVINYIQKYFGYDSTNRIEPLEYFHVTENKKD